MPHRIVLLSLFVVVACATQEPESLPERLVLAAVENEGAIAVLDADSGDLLRTVRLPRGDGAGFMAHNVQADDAGMIWTTAMPAGAGHDHGAAADADRLFGIATADLAITSAIDLGHDQQPAHVVIDSGTAYVTATAGDAVLVVDLVAGAVVRTIELPAGTGPHGARLDRAHGLLAVAGMGGATLVLIDVATGEVDVNALPGRAIQTALAPDGSAVYATIYDTRQVARFELATRALTLFDLPAGSAGPVQLYPTPDGRRLWVADQGIVDGAPTGHTVIELDAVTGAIERVVEVGAGPHGVVVSRDGAQVWITTIVDGTVQAIDTATGTVTLTTAVGSGPNGISYLDANGALP